MTETISNNKKSCLDLVSKTVTDSGVLYSFEVEGKQEQLTKEESVRLIQKYPARDRNCRISGDNIVRKANCGILPVIRHTDKPEYQPNPLSLLKHGRRTVSGVNIFTGEAYRSLCTLNSNDMYFHKVMNDPEFIQKYASLLKKIDKAEIVNFDLIKIETPFGVCDLGDISTGLKTLLNILYIREREKKNVFYMVNIDECGDNVLPYIYEAVNNSTIALYLNHMVHKFPENTDYYVNTIKTENAVSFYIEMKKGGFPI